MIADNLHADTEVPPRKCSTQRIHEMIYEQFGAMVPACLPFCLRAGPPPHSLDSLRGQSRRVRFFRDGCVRDCCAEVGLNNCATEERKRIRTMAPFSPDPQKLLSLEGRTFSREDVVLDGRTYFRCSFLECRLIYRGGPCRMTSCY